MPEKQVEGSFQWGQALPHVDCPEPPGLDGSGLGPTVLEEGGLQEGGQLHPVILQWGRKAWGDEEARPTLSPPRLAAHTAHLMQEAIVHQLCGEVLGTVSCTKDVG
jgi:hypothetical protein